MELVLVADTHVPSRAPAVPEWVRTAVADADHVIHAGDFDARETLEDLRDLAEEFTAVSGNMDRGLGLPEVATLDRGGVRFVVTHGTGSPAGYESRVAGVVDDHAAVDRPTVGVAGHTHEVLDARVDGYRLLNPGSATAAAPASEATLYHVELDADESDDEFPVTLHRG